MILSSPAPYIVAQRTGSTSGLQVSNLPGQRTLVTRAGRAPTKGGLASSTGIGRARRSPPYTWKSPFKPRVSSTRIRSTKHDTSNSEDTGDAKDTTNALVKSLLLSFLASQNRSFFASKSFVETVMAFYEQGYSLDAIKNAATFNTISLGSMNEPMMLDVMLAWATCVYVTLEESRAMSTESDDREEREERDEQEEREEAGSVAALRNMARMWIQKYREEGLTFQGLLMQQNVQEMSQEGSAGEFVRVMQQNARLVLLTLEMVEGGNKGTGATDDASDDNHHSSPLDFSMPGLVSGMMDMPDDPLDEDDRIGCRPLAVRLLLAFNAAALGYLVGARTFVETAGHLYVCGFTADDVYLALDQAEFEQGGGFQVRVARPPGGTSVSQALFSRWLSIVYMTMAKLGVAHPKAAQAEGWAWVCSLQSQAKASGDPTGGSGDIGGSLEAHGVFDFVVHTLHEKAESESEEEEIDLDAPPKDYFDGFTFKYQDEDLARVSSFALVVKQQVSLVEMTKQMILPRLASSVGTL